MTPTNQKRQCIVEYEEALSETYQDVLNVAVNKVENEYQNIEPFSLLRKGRPFDVIPETSNGEEVDLIVMGSHGMGGIIGFLGSTSLHVVESQLNQF
jgi:nucleotide-binding universal stress UspA family protein